ncbi:CDK5 and ABL1 enzyme substrate 2-like [Gossypium australe]|uniref:CDK5 and ABL1 enzyme substrate 2-like n=1 Tax=Gossypium australe TaxID=47621 RepID=A0A5B6WNY7_9ROSI|nr:CDK5 and ABL1 enzyme substrate 2-like [Gossypium australe]
MKNVSRNKFLLCFRPVVDMDLMLDPKAVVVGPSQNRRALTYLTVKNKADILKPSTPQSSSSDTENSIMVHRPGKKRFSHVIKAVVFEILLAKRVKDRKDIPLSSHGKLLDASADESVNKVSAAEGVQGTVSKPNSVPNSTQKTSKHQEPEMKPKQEGIQKSCSSSSSSSSNAIFMLVISLAVTIFWGKICAILLTSIWLYFLPHHQQPAGVIENLESITKSSEKKSKDYYRKKVIMEGLLQRKQSRGAFNF